MEHRFSDMTNAQLAESNPLVATLVFVGFVAAIFLLILGNKALCRKAAGWSDLIRQFPAPEIERPGDVFKSMSGWIGGTEFKQSFTLQLIQEGLLVRPEFAARSPILIPWLHISEVKVSEGLFLGHKQNLILKMACEKLVQFSLPPDVLPTIEKNVPAARFCKVKIPSSVSELLKERLQSWKT